MIVTGSTFEGGIRTRDLLFNEQCLNSIGLLFMILRISNTCSSTYTAFSGAKSVEFQENPTSTYTLY